MSRNLQEKLAKYHHTKGIRNLLSAISEVNVITHPVEGIDFDAIETRISETCLNSSVPDRSLPKYSTSPLTTAAWIAAALADSSIHSSAVQVPVKHHNIYLRIYDFYAAGWIEVQSKHLDQTLWDIWQRLTNKELYIVSYDLTKSLILSDDEHEWEAFWSNPIRHD
jgi:hypothetical protein